MSTYSDFTSTPIYNQAALGYPKVGIYAAFEVPLHLTSYQNATRSPTIAIQTGIPNIDVQSNVAWGGVVALSGLQQLPKITMQGFIDTPSSSVNGWRIPSLTRFTPPQNMTYLELMMLAYEGNYTELGSTANVGKIKVEPLYFRDPLGRVYSNPRVISIEGSFIAAVPFRNNFNMTLQI